MLLFPSLKKFTLATQIPVKEDPRTQHFPCDAGIHQATFDDHYAREQLERIAQTITEAVRAYFSLSLPKVRKRNSSYLRILFKVFTSPPNP